MPRTTSYLLLFLQRSSIIGTAKINASLYRARERATRSISAHFVWYIYVSEWLLVGFELRVAHSTAQGLTSGPWKLVSSQGLRAIKGYFNWSIQVQKCLDWGIKSHNRLEGKLRARREWENHSTVISFEFNTFSPFKKKFLSTKRINNGDKRPLIP